MSELIQCFGEMKDIMSLLEDTRCHPEMSYDALRKRLKRGGPLSIPEIALTTPLIKGSQRGDTKQRIQDRKLKQRELYKKFVLAQNVRAKYEAGVEKAEIKQRFDLTESYYNKIIGHQYNYNIHWSMCRPGEVPEHFKEIKRDLEYVPGAKDNLQKYEAKQ